MSQQMKDLVGHARALVCRLLAGTLIVACGEAEPVDAPGGRELLEHVQTVNYRAWQRAPGWEARMPSIGDGHGGQLDIYVNDVVASALDSGRPVPRLPAGSTIVKDIWNGTNLHSIAIMDKRQDGWYWAEFSGNGEVLAAGHPQGCIACHERGKDLVRAFTLP